MRIERRSQTRRVGMLERKEKVQAVVTTLSMMGARKNISWSMVRRKKRARQRVMGERR
jgi:hypothetical protein